MVLVTTFKFKLTLFLGILTKLMLMICRIGTGTGPWNFLRS